MKNIYRKMSHRSLFYKIGWIFNKISSGVFICSMVSFISNIKGFEEIHNLFRDYILDFIVIWDRIGKIVSLVLYPYHYMRNWILMLFELDITEMQADALFLASLLFGLWSMASYRVFENFSYRTSRLTYLAIKHMINDIDRSYNNNIADDLTSAIKRSNIFGLAVGPVNDLARGLRVKIPDPYLSNRIDEAILVIDHGIKYTDLKYDAITEERSKGFSGIRLKTYSFLSIIILILIDVMFFDVGIDIVRLVFYVPSVAFTMALLYFGFILSAGILFLAVMLSMFVLTRKFPGWYISRLFKDQMDTLLAEIFVGIWSPKNGVPPRISSMVPNLGHVEIYQAILANGEKSIVMKHTRDISYSMIKKVTMELNSKKVSFYAITKRTIPAFGSIEYLNEIDVGEAKRVNIQFCPEGSIIDSVWVEISVRP